jgi:hypothetical protein
VAIDSTLIHINYVFLFVHGHCPLIGVQKSILNDVGERRKKVEDVGEFPFEVRLEFFDGVRVGRQVN